MQGRDFSVTFMLIKHFSASSPFHRESTVWNVADDLPPHGTAYSHGGTRAKVNYTTRIRTCHQRLTVLKPPAARSQGTGATVMGCVANSGGIGVFEECVYLESPSLCLPPLEDVSGFHLIFLCRDKLGGGTHT